MFITTGFYWDQDEQTRAFSRRYFERTKKMPTMMQAAVYSAVLHYLKAIKAAGTDDAQAVMAKMKATEVNDAVVRKGKIRDDGRLVHDMMLVQVKTPAESTRAWDLYKIKQVIPGDQAFHSLALSRCSLIKKRYRNDSCLRLSIKRWRPFSLESSNHRRRIGRHFEEHARLARRDADGVAFLDAQTTELVGRQMRF